VLLLLLLLLKTAQVLISDHSAGLLGLEQLRGAC
jgi:hypothetical protein